jgi:CHAT domain-containing protein
LGAFLLFFDAASSLCAQDIWQSQRANAAAVSATRDVGVYYPPASKFLVENWTQGYPEQWKFATPLRAALALDMATWHLSMESLAATQKWIAIALDELEASDRSSAGLPHQRLSLVARAHNLFMRLQLAGGHREQAAAMLQRVSISRVRFDARQWLIVLEGLPTDMISLALVHSEVPEQLAQKLDLDFSMWNRRILSTDQFLTELIMHAGTGVVAGDQEAAIEEQFQAVENELRDQHASRSRLIKLLESRSSWHRALAREALRPANPTSPKTAERVQRHYNESLSACERLLAVKDCDSVPDRVRQTRAALQLSRDRDNPDQANRYYQFALTRSQAVAVEKSANHSNLTEQIELQKLRLAAFLMSQTGTSSEAKNEIQQWKAISNEAATLAGLLQPLVPDECETLSRLQYIQALGSFHGKQPVASLEQLEKLRSRLRRETIGADALAAVDLFLANLSLQTRSNDLVSADDHFLRAERVNAGLQQPANQRIARAGRATLLSLAGNYEQADELFAELLDQKLLLGEGQPASSLVVAQHRQRILYALSLKNQARLIAATRQFEHVRRALGQLPAQDMNSETEELRQVVELCIADTLRCRHDFAGAVEILDALDNAIQDAAGDVAFREELSHQLALCELADPLADAATWNRAQVRWQGSVDESANLLVRCRSQFYLSELNRRRLERNETLLQRQRADFRLRLSEYDENTRQLNEEIKRYESSSTTPPQSEYDTLALRHAQLEQENLDLNQLRVRLSEGDLQSTLVEARQWLKQSHDWLVECRRELGDLPAYPTLQYAVRCRLADVLLQIDDDNHSVAIDLLTDAERFSDQPIAGVDLLRRDWLLSKFSYARQRLVELRLASGQVEEAVAAIESQKSRRFRDLALGLTPNQAQAFDLVNSQLRSLRMESLVHAQDLNDQMEACAKRLDGLNVYSQHIDSSPSEIRQIPGFLIVYQIGQRSSHVLWRTSQGKLWNSRSLQIESRPLTWESLSHVDTESGKLVGYAIDFSQVVSNPATTSADLLQNAASRLLAASLLPRELLADLSDSDQTHVVVIPDGPLFHFPLEALPTSTRHFLYELAPPIVYSPTLEWLTGPSGITAHPASSSVPDDRKQCLLTVGLGELMTGNGGREVIVGNEANQIANAFAEQGLPTVKLFHHAAVRREVMASLAKATWVHFGTHAERLKPVALAMDNDTGDDDALAAQTPRSLLRLAGDEVLTDQQIRALDLGAELVAIAACQSALVSSDVSQGNIVDPSYSLAGAFLISGVARVVASHWKVDAESTSTAMASLFQQIATATSSDSSPPSTAQYAQWVKHGRDALRSTPAYDRPFHWSAFTLQTRVP